MSKVKGCRKRAFGKLAMCAVVEYEELSGLGDLPLQDARVVQAMDYWRSLRRKPGLPPFRDVDPAAIVRLLPHIWFWTFDSAESEYFGRLAGENILDLFGPHTMRGQPLSEFGTPGLAGLMRERFDRVVSEPAVLHFRGRTVLDNGLRVETERLVLPMVDDGQDKPVVMGLSVYSWPNGVRAQSGYAGEEGVNRWSPVDS